MAGTIKLMVASRWQPAAGVEIPFQAVPADQEITTTGDNSFGGEMNITTSAAEIPLGSVTVGGIWHVQNPNATGSIVISVGGTTNLVTIPPGEQHVFRLHADNAAPDAEISAGTGIMRYRVYDA